MLIFGKTEISHDFGFPLDLFVTGSSPIHKSFEILIIVISYFKNGGRIVGGS